MVNFLKIKKQLNYLILLLIMAVLFQDIPIFCQKKNTGKYDFRLVWLVDRLGEFLSGKIPLGNSSMLFISSEDLKILGIASVNVKKVSERILKEKIKFEDMLKKYNAQNQKKIHLMKSIELKDAEFIPFMEGKDQKTENMVLALKGVTIYYQAMDSGNSSSTNIVVKIPAIFLLKDRWRISELESINEIKIPEKH
jgi:hypothetical protein